MALSAADWLSVVRREYLEDFIPAGGAAVKFVVPYPPLDHQELSESLRRAADDSGFQFVFVDSVATKIHQIVDGHGRPLVVLLSPGQAGDAPMFAHLMRHLRVGRPGRGRPRTRLRLPHSYSRQGR